MSNTERTLQDVNYRTDDAVAVIEIDRPDVYNSIRHETVSELEEAYERARTNDVQAILLRSVGDTAFCTGADLGAVESYIEDGEAIESFLADLQQLVIQFAQGPLPVVAAVNGQALAGGLELVLGCDIVVADTDAVFGDQHANFDLVAGGGGTQLLPRIVGRRRAKYLILTGESIDAQTAEDWGLVTEVSTDSETRAREIAEMVSSPDPVVTKRAKELIETGLDCSLATGMKLEREVASKHLQSAVAKAGIERFKEG